MTYTQALSLLTQHGQTQLLSYYHQLSPAQQTQLLQDISRIDFSVLSNLGASSAQKELGTITPIQAVGLEEISRRRSEFEEVGLNLLRQNKVGAVLLAGGQGSRLGFDKPKGMFNIGVTRTLSIFQQQMHNAFNVTNKSGCFFHLFVMTSLTNNSETQEFFKQNNYFGYPPEKIHFFVQDVAPACGFDGSIFLDQTYRVALTPNGNGGWYSSMQNCGLGQVIKDEGIQWLNVYGVDNVLQRMCDPVFIGATVKLGCACGAKVVRKVSAEERVGILCNENGKPTVIEYYEMPEHLKNLTQNGRLVYPYGVILNYLFRVEDLNRIIKGKLPYHLAKKAIAHVEDGRRVTPAQPCGYKFETLVVDMVRLVDSCLAFEVDRESEFAPVKNATGVDSVQTARELLIKNGVSL